ncbi:MAG: hypothetical protein A4E40_00863 [Methanoregulaceae archaeon PtaU1.Bin059]|nr:MAG: hypothetical protein A4E39_00424 [Methanoregulaceae archaeon PtaB.Bin152]OPY40284.1 MAG: hypothetical protein A4E40_00863 [Methanoregulaceae archaeon PtaU1.Bin059]
MGIFQVDYILLCHPILNTTIRRDLSRKSAYFRRVEGSDSETYIVASGMYTPCAE